MKSFSPEFCSPLNVFTQKRLLYLHFFSTKLFFSHKKEGKDIKVGKERKVGNIGQKIGIVRVQKKFQIASNSFKLVHMAPNWSK